MKRTIVAVRLLNSITVYYGNTARQISLYCGDITALTQSEKVDYIAVSAFPNDYQPFPNCIIGDLNNRGVSVLNLSKDKLVDYRTEIPCWISREILGQDYKRILVYEPKDPKKNSCEQAGYVFSALANYAQGTSGISAAVPLFSTSYGGVSPKEMLRALFFAAVHWGAMKFPFTAVKIVIKNDDAALKEEFNNLKKQYEEIEKLDISQGYKIIAGEAYTKAGTITPKAGDILTRRQLFAILMYTSGYYATIHRVVKLDKKSEEYMKHEPLFEALDTALMNIKPYPNKLYRGNSAMTSEEISSHKNGADIQVQSYTSYAYKEGPFYNNRKYKFQMGQPLTGSLVESYSFYTHENEVLFDRRMIYTVKNQEKKNNDYYYYVDEKFVKFRI